MVDHMELNEFFSQNPRAALAFSGGTDSAFLLWAARKSGADIKAYYVNTAFQPDFELADAKRLADSLGAEMEIITLDILQDRQITDNPVNRCYYCKRQIFSAITKAAGRDGYNILLDGTNASDPEADRPGKRALKELKVLSPLRICSLSKDVIRQRSKEAGLFTWDKPAYACLATRIPAGTPIIKADLQRTEICEEALSQMGFRDFRIRLMNGSARLQLTETQLPLLVKKRQEVLAVLQQHYTGALLDLEVRL